MTSRQHHSVDRDSLLGLPQALRGRMTDTELTGEIFNDKRRARHPEVMLTRSQRGDDATGEEWRLPVGDVVE